MNSSKPEWSTGVSEAKVRAIWRRYHRAARTSQPVHESRASNLSPKIYDLHANLREHRSKEGKRQTEDVGWNTVNPVHERCSESLDTERTGKGQCLTAGGVGPYFILSRMPNLISVWATSRTRTPDLVSIRQ